MIENKFNKNQIKIIVIIFLILIILLKCFEWFMFSKTEIVLGKINRETEQSKGGKSTRYLFIFKNQVVEGKMSNSELKNISIDSLKKMENVKIEVSEYWTFFNRIVDKRVLK